MIIKSIQRSRLRRLGRWQMWPPLPPLEARPPLAPHPWRPSRSSAPRWRHPPLQRSAPASVRAVHPPAPLPSVCGVDNGDCEDYGLDGCVFYSNLRHRKTLQTIFQLQNVFMSTSLSDLKSSCSDKISSCPFPLETFHVRH
jgi:hypothetical protein